MRTENGLTIKVNGKTYPLDITANTDTMVDAVISTVQLQALIADMNKADSLTVIAGSGAPVIVSLNGSNVAISAYLTCANISAPTGDTPAGANPFASSPSQQLVSLITRFILCRGPLGDVTRSSYVRRCKGRARRLLNVRVNLVNWGVKSLALSKGRPSTRQAKSRRILILNLFAFTT
jgi:hypothetical protein